MVAGLFQFGTYVADAEAIGADSLRGADDGTIPEGGDPGKDAPADAETDGETDDETDEVFQFGTFVEVGTEAGEMDGKTAPWTAPGAVDADDDVEQEQLDGGTAPETVPGPVDADDVRTRKAGKYKRPQRHTG